MIQQLIKRIQKWHPANKPPMLIEEMDNKHLENSIRMLMADPATMRALIALRMMIELEGRAQGPFDHLDHETSGMVALGQD